MTSFFDPKTLTSYPEEPGVYLMKNSQGVVLYVGKAKNVKKRLRQYFAPLKENRPQIQFLITEVASIETIVVDSEKEALLLENTLIKKHQPKYNILLRDDKTYLSICLSHHPYPKLELTRYKQRPPKDKNEYFGPYTDARAAKETLDLIQHLFPLRQCSDKMLASRKRPCILYSLKRCIAPCTKMCTDAEYAAHVQRAEKFLKGQDKEILKNLKTAMEKASKNLQFEEAQKYFELMKKIKHVTEVQHVDNQKTKECDVIGLCYVDSEALIALLHYEHYKLVGSSHFSFSNIFSEKEELLSCFCMQYYLTHKSPEEIILPLDTSECLALEKILEKEHKKKVHVISPTKGEKKHLLALAEKNAYALFKRQKELKLQKEKILLELQSCLKLSRYPRHIDCFDVSHIAEKFRVAAKITFFHGNRSKESTRYYKILTEKPGDIFALQEALLRYLTKVKEEKHLPDLLMIDGGMQQMNIAKKTLEKLNIATVDVIGLSKEKGRHDKSLRHEKIFVTFQKEPVVLLPTSPLLHFLQNIRDETHRSAIGLHRKQRVLAIKKSYLDGIPGIGPQKKQKILQHFASKNEFLHAEDALIRSKTTLSFSEIKKIRISLKK